MFGFGKKKASATNTDTKDTGATSASMDAELKDAKIPSGMKETAQRMMSGEFDLNDMLAQLKQIKKMSNSKRNRR